MAEPSTESPRESEIVKELPAQPAPIPPTLPTLPKKKRTRLDPAQLESKDSLREVIETVVFVVVLVLLLKSFVAEAFVIPTGSMAETLWGYQKVVNCPKCGYVFPVNCSCEVDPQQEMDRSPVIGCICPNCRYDIQLNRDFEDANRPGWNTGDRVLVGKYFYDLNIFGLDGPKRQEVVVFKFPNEPQRKHTPMNYIKRLVGLPGETIAIFYGKLYQRSDLKYDDSDVQPTELWQEQYMHKDASVELFLQDESKAPANRKFTILRKEPTKVMSERRMVYNNDHQAKDLYGKVKPRWQPVDAKGFWMPLDASDTRKFIHVMPKEQKSLEWLRYHHLIPGKDRNLAQAQLITDFMGYNTWQPDQARGHALPAENWVGDLMLDLQVNVMQPEGIFALELSKGIDRFRARFDLATGRCSLVRVVEGKEVELASHETTMKTAGKFHLRFANVDERLIVWVDNSLPFAEGVPYDPPIRRGPYPNDLEPASIGAMNAAVEVSNLQLWRDTYYTSTADKRGLPDAGEDVNMADPDRWEPLRRIQPRTYFVQPGHYLCMGDNSPESWDGRSWGVVPSRLLLGRALLIYYPFGSRTGRIQ